MRTRNIYCCEEISKYIKFFFLKLTRAENNVFHICVLTSCLFFTYTSCKCLLFIDGRG